MLFKGDKIKQTKEINGFNQVGEIFEVTNVSEDGTISFQCEFGVGVMSYDEFEKHFEKIVELVWGEWIRGNYTYRTNGKDVEVNYGGLIERASCAPSDTFDLNKGIALCVARIDVRMAKEELRAMLKYM